MRTVFPELVEPDLDPEMVAAWTQFEARLNEAERNGEPTQKLIARFIGEFIGELIGELKHGRSMLRRQLEHRFGALPPAQLVRLDCASLDELDAMTLRVLTAATVDEVLGA